jgi:hypothetical protein
MAQLEQLPDMVFYTQITMEAAEDPEFLAAMNRARIRGARRRGVGHARRIEGGIQELNDAGRRSSPACRRSVPPASAFRLIHLRCRLTHQTRLLRRYDLAQRANPSFAQFSAAISSTWISPGA